MSMTLLIAATLGTLVSMCLAMVRSLLGPTVYDRILAVNMFGTKTVILIGILGFLSNRPAFLDIALVYALMNFITVIAILRFSNFDGGRLIDAESSTNYEATIYETKIDEVQS